MTTITLHPTVKAVSGGFVPMITARGAKGRMLGSKCPQGGYREFHTFTCRIACEIDARLIALRAALARPDMFTVAA